MRPVHHPYGSALRQCLHPSSVCYDSYWPGPQHLYELQPVYGFANSSKDGVRFLRAAGHSDLYFLEDREASFDQVLPILL